MEKRIPLYVKKNHWALWLTVLCLLASCVTRVAVFCRTDDMRIWPQLLLPVTAAIWFALKAILAGEERLYQTAVPIWLLGIAMGWQSIIALQDAPFLWVVVCIAIVFFCDAYTCLISGRWRWTWLLLPMYLLVLGMEGYVHTQLLFRNLPIRAIWYVLPDYLLVIGLMVMLFALKVHTDGQYHPTWGDRADGRKIRSAPPIDRIGPYIMVNRTGANNQFSESVEITELERYVRRKRKAGMTGLGVTHVIIAAYVRTVARYPALNRFIAGQKVYSRGEDISLSMTVKKELSVASPDTVIKVHLNPHDTLEDVYRKFSEQVEEAKNTPLDSGVDNAAGALSLIPGLVLKFVVWLLKTLDYFGQIPAFLLEISPFHGSAYFTSMGSLGIRPVYHHLYDFGTIPVFCAFGRKRRAEEIANGQIVTRKYMDLKFNLDERICDGYYYASAIKHFLRILSRPEVLDEPPAVVTQDIP